MTGLRRVGVGLCLAILLVTNTSTSHSAGSSADVEFTVTVDSLIRPTVSYQQDSGDTRLVTTIDGSWIWPYNFPAEYAVMVRTSAGVAELHIKVCNNSQVDKDIHFYDCDNPGGGSIDVTLRPGECYETNDYNCASDV